MMINFHVGEKITFIYKNYKGEVSRRTVICGFIQYGSNEYHPEEQMFLKCFCLDRESYRSFAICDISNIKKVED